MALPAFDNLKCQQSGTGTDISDENIQFFKILMERSTGVEMVFATTDNKKEHISSSPD